MRCVRRSDSDIGIGVGMDIVVGPFELVVPAADGGEVLMGRRLAVFVRTQNTQVDVRFEYTHDFGLTWTDRGTTQAVLVNQPMFQEQDAPGQHPLAVGTAVRVRIENNQVAAATIDYEMHLV